MTPDPRTGTFRALVPLLALRLFVGGVVAVYAPYAILSSYPEQSLAVPGALAITGGLVIAVGTALYLWCIWDFAFYGQGMAPRVLVARGAYTLVRNPMYVGLMLILLGEALLFRSWRLLGYSAALWVCLHLLVTLYEERAASDVFGTSYEQYRREVGRWFPRVRRGQRSGVA